MLTLSINCDTIKEVDNLVNITQEMANEISKIISKGNTAEVVKLKHEIVIFEKKQENRISVPVKFQG